MSSQRVHLLDGNVLIALTTPDHTDFAKVKAWFDPQAPFATCPITQGTLIRHYYRVADRPTSRDATRLLRTLTELPGHVFWPDDISFLDLVDGVIRGHRQVTDAYLASLAAARGGVLVTLDRALVACYRSHCELLE